MVPSLLRLRPTGNEPDTIFQEYGVTPPEALSMESYAISTVPFGRELVPMTTPFFGFTVNEKACSAVWGDAEESTTWSVKLNCPDAVAVPVMPPLLASVRPEGRDPEITENLYGEVPPVACTDAVYETPTAAVGKLLIENWTGTAVLLFVEVEVEPEENPLQPTVII
jgi:hypothetical protein